MKKITALMLALCMCISLCACGTSTEEMQLQTEETQSQKSSAVIDAENAISAIGEVTIESKGLIETAEAMYAILTNAEKEMVSNRSELALARQTYNNLEIEQKHTDMLADKNNLLSCLRTAQDKLSFVSKYAGNVNNAGQRKFADSFLEELKHCLDSIELTLLEEEIPGITEEVAKIKAGCLAVHDMLVDMGNTNSGKNVAKIKEEALNTNKLVTELMNGSINNIH